MFTSEAGQDGAFEPLNIKVDPRFDALEEDRRFESVARKMGPD